MNEKKKQRHLKLIFTSSNKGKVPTTVEVCAYYMFRWKHECKLHIFELQASHGNEA